MLQIVDTYREVRSVDYETSIDVEADSEEEAQAKAEAIADDNDSDVEWEEGDWDIDDRQPQLCHSRSGKGEDDTNRYVRVMPQKPVHTWQDGKMVDVFPDVVA
jgi:hypothetical protein